MQFSDSNTPQIEPEAAQPARRGFFSRLFGSRSKGSSEEKKNELVEQQTLTTENLESHNDVTGHGESKSVEGDRRSNASSISRSSRGSIRSRHSRVSRASHASHASHASQASRASHVSHGSHMGRGGVHNPETIMEEEDEESVFEDESFDDMRKRVDRDELLAYPAGQRQGFWEARRKAFFDLPLPPAPARPSQVEGEYAGEAADDEPQGTATVDDDSGSSGMLVSPSKSTLGTTAGGSNPSSPYQQQQSEQEQEQEEEEKPPLRPVDTFTRGQRIVYLRGTLPAESRAALEQDLKSHRQLRRQFKHKLTLVTLSGEKKIPIPPPRVPPPFV